MGPCEVNKTFSNKQKAEQFLRKELANFFVWQLNLCQNINKLDVQRGLHILPVSPFEALIATLWPSGYHIAKFEANFKIFTNKAYRPNAHLLDIPNIILLL